MLSFKFQRHNKKILHIIYSCICRMWLHTSWNSVFVLNRGFKLLIHTSQIAEWILVILYPYFIHPLHTFIKRNIAYIQNYTTKCKKCFVILKNISNCDRVKALLQSTYLLWNEFQTIIRSLKYMMYQTLLASHHHLCQWVDIN